MSSIAAGAAVPMPMYPACVILILSLEYEFPSAAVWKTKAPGVSLDQGVPSTSASIVTL